MQPICNRRQALGLSAGIAVSLGVPDSGRSGSGPTQTKGRVEGWPEAAKVGEKILAAGGNAVDALVAAALVAGVTAPQMCGPGGYGGHTIIAADGGKKVSAIDFNTAAPAAARPHMFPIEPSGRVKDRANAIGWLAAGVPGTLAGLQLALDRFGTLPLSKVMEPAIQYAREGFPMGISLANAIRANRSTIQRYPATAKLLLADGDPPKAGTKFRNPDLAVLLETLAKRQSVDSFYRGDIARQIAESFAHNGGGITAADLAAYRAREVEPLKLRWNGFTIYTPPPTAGGETILQALAVLKELGWKEGFAKAKRAQVEALRAAWRDRLQFLGDPAKADVPVERLLGAEHIQRLAEEVAQALKADRPIAARTDGRSGGGTIHLSAADGKGNFAALTLTHGEAFGSMVTIAGLGLILGHGISRFEPKPGHPNSIGPGKRPLHNMCPTLVLRDGKAILSLGGRGGRRIPNALFEVLSQFIGLGRTPDKALAAPRLHTEGGLDLQLEKNYPAEEVADFRRVGYTVRVGSSATVSAVWTDAKRAEIHSGTR